MRSCGMLVKYGSLATLYDVWLITTQVIYHCVAYLRDPFEYRQSRSGPEIPGPLIAKLSDIWLSRKAVLGDRSGEVHKLHRKYGMYSVWFVL
jgi:benzoate 4-monooxygenase